ncbi:MAG: hypothetical protein QOI34_88 [Verrucomicrobiota bacterium]|jgi:hypothetical protein
MRGNWWTRNWKWFVPAGCLTFIALGIACILGIVLIVFGAVKSSDVYKVAFERAKSDSRVQQAIGTPIKEGWFVSGNTNVNGGSGTSDLAIPIRGPKGKATIYAVATKSTGKWKYSKLVVTFEQTADTVDLADNTND